MKEEIKSNIILVAVLILVAVFTYSTLQDQTQSGPDDTLIRAEAEREIFKTQFMNACDSGGDLTNYCLCSYDYLTDNYDFETLIEIGQEKTADGNYSEVQKEIINAAVLECSGEL